MTRRRIRAIVATGTSAVLTTALLSIGLTAVHEAAAAPSVVPAASKKYVSCTYVVGRAGSTDCSKTTFTADYSFNFNVCWRLRPSSKTYLERRVATGWVRDKRDVSIGQGNPCRGQYPWRTATRIAVKAGQTRTQEYRFVLPKTWQYARVDYAFGVCVLPAGSRGPCPPFPTPTPTPTATPTPTITASPVPTITAPPAPTGPSPTESTLP